MPHHRLIRALKAACPTITVKVRCSRLKAGLCGDCLRMEDHFRIRVNTAKPYQVQVDTLIHEFAHAEAYLEHENGVEHGPMWGVAHAKFYTVAMKVLGG